MEIPDCRKGTGLYNAKYLNKEDKGFVAGFDAGVETVINFFNNLHIYMEDLLEADFNVKKVDETAVMKQYDDCMSRLSDEDTEGKQDCLSEEDFEKLNDRTKLMCVLMYCIADWSEMERNSVITSFIDRMSEEELEVNKAKYEEDKENNDSL